MLAQQRGDLGPFCSLEHTHWVHLWEGGTQKHLSLQELKGALVSGLVCRSAAHSSWVFVSLWGSVSE